MPRDMNAQPHPIDDELARLTDQLLDGTGPEMMDMKAQDEELSALMETVRGLDRSFRATQPDRAMENRIKANLIKEWQKSGPQSIRTSIWERLFSPPQVATRLVIAAAVLALIILALPLTGSFGGEPLKGTAGEANPALSPVWLVGGLLVMTGIVWLITRRRH